MDETFVSRDFLRRAEGFQKRIGYQFSKPGLLQLAFVRRSSEKSQFPSRNNERLEFLGDAAIGLIVGAALYGEYPEADEGFMTIERSKLVCGQNLSAWGYEAGFDRMISAGEGVAISAAMVEDSVEAVAGALFLDGGLDAVRRFLRSFGDYPDRGTGFDARLHLRRDCELEKLGVPRYKTRLRFANGGMIHESTVTLNGEETGTGLGKSQEEAERNAARDALGRLNRVSAQEQRKRAAVWRAHFRRVLSGRASGRKRQEYVTLDDGGKEDDRAAGAKRADSLEVRVEGRVDSGRKPAYVAAAFRDGRRIAEGRGESKNAAMREASRAARALDAPAKKKSAASYLESLDMPALRESPDLKGALQTCCERLGLGQPEYADVPQTVKWKTPYFTVELKLKGARVATGGGTSKKAASRLAAWKTLQLLALGVPEDKPAPPRELTELGGRLERAFDAVVASGGVKPPVYDIRERAKDAVFSCRVTVEGKSPADACGDDEAQARLHAVVKAVGQYRLWPAVLNRLEISQALQVPASEGRPDRALERYLKKNGGESAVSAAIPLDGGKQAPRFRLGLFVKDELAAGATGPEKKAMETLLSLLLLDRLARKRPLIPPAGGEDSARRPGEKRPAEQARAKPETLGRVSLKKRVAGWLRRVADAYIKN